MVSLIMSRRASRVSCGGTFICAEMIERLTNGWLAAARAFRVSSIKNLMVAGLAMLCQRVMKTRPKTPTEQESGEGEGSGCAAMASKG